MGRNVYMRGAVIETEEKNSKLSKSSLSLFFSWMNYYFLI